MFVLELDQQFGKIPELNDSKKGAGKVPQTVVKFLSEHEADAVVPTL